MESNESIKIITCVMTKVGWFAVWFYSVDLGCCVNIWALLSK